MQHPVFLPLDDLAGTNYISIFFRFIRKDALNEFYSQAFSFAAGQLGGPDQRYAIVFAQFLQLGRESGIRYQSVNLR